ncbi:hypothetical protein [Streptomyces flaveolus]
MDKVVSAAEKQPTGQRGEPCGDMCAEITGVAQNEYAHAVVGLP